METRITAKVLKTASGQFDLESVRNLCLSHLGLRKLENLDLCPNIVELDISYNKLRSLKGLEGLENIRVVKVIGNEIENLDGLEGLPSLERLYLQDNCIRDLKELKKLTSLPNLRFLHLKNADGTSANAEEGYFDTVTKMLPELKVLDGRRIQLQLLLQSSHVELDEDEEIAVPPSEPWLKNFSWDISGVEGNSATSSSKMSQVERQFKGNVAEFKQQIAQADALLKQFKEST